MLKSTHPWRDAITLMPFSGIQFVDYRLKTTGLGRFSKSFVERVVERDEERQKRALIALTGDDEIDGKMLGQRQPDDEEYTINRERALEPFLDCWIPVPYLRVMPSKDRGGVEVFDQGPTNWARMRIIQIADEDDPQATQLHIVFAFDTELAERNRNRAFLVPSPEHAKDEVAFAFVADPRTMQWYLSDDRPGGGDWQKWVAEWLMELFLEFRNASRPDKPLSIEDLPRPLEPWARYLTLLAFVKEHVQPRPVRLIDNLTPNRYAPVLVDLVLDIGNSRTCGMLVESNPNRDSVDLNDSYVLELRDLGRPHQVYREPFESRIEFSQADFGKHNIARRSGRAQSFVWPSMVRVGPEAMRIIGDNEGTESTTGMSSPKRYLWDESGVNQDWRFQAEDYPVLGQDPAALMAARTFINETGDVLSQVQAEVERGLRRQGDTSDRGAMQSRFSRSSIYSFMITEIVYQALVQINGASVRYRRRDPEVPRRLRNVILMLPPATPLQEQQIMRSRVEGGIRLIYDILGWRERGDVPMPAVLIDWDEASCNHLVWLYAEIMQKFSGQVESFIELVGRPRVLADPPDGTGIAAGSELPSLRLASIDIGGGTTDLMITTYHVAGNRALIPTQNFREGFRIAGDDIVRAVIEDLVLPQLQEQLEVDGMPHARELMLKLFGGDRQEMAEQDRHHRRQFVLRVLIPLALALIHKSESSDREPQHAGDLLKVGEVLELEAIDGGWRPGTLFEYADRVARAHAGRTVPWADLTIRFEPARLGDAVGRVMREVLFQIGEAIWTLDCDIVLLAGRPSKLPAIHTLIREQLAVTPDRIVRMDRYPAGIWYPFRSRDNLTISDPKTTAVVGCMLCALADPNRPDGSRLENFTLFTERMRMRSTARFIGEMDTNGQIRTDKVLFSDIDLDRPGSDEMEAELTMYTPLRVGFRQMPFERWTATPLYRLEFTESGARRTKPFKLVIARAEVVEVDEEPSKDPEKRLRQEAKRRLAEMKHEQFGVIEVQDSQGDPCRLGDIRLRLQTLGFEDSYWLDTGIVTVH